MADPLAPFRLAGHRVDPSLNRITAPSGATVQVEPKIMQVLAVLAERAGHVVSRDDLMARVWNGVFVTDDALHRAIRELRRLFGDEAERPRVIETIRKRGYRLIAAVEPVAAASPTTAIPAPVVPRPQSDWMPGPLALIVLLAAAMVGGAALVSLGIVKPAPSLPDARVRFMPFTSEPGNEVDPALSPSGRLAYVARGSDGRPHVFTKTTPDAAAVQITRGHASERAPAWSPDESQLAFARIDERGCTIWIAPADGRDGRAVLPCLAVDELRMSWSPDGQQIAVGAGAGNARSPGRIEVVTIADARHRALTDPPPGQSGDWSPAFSPDGREIAFVRTISGSVADVYVVPAAGGRPRRVTADNADVLGVDWEPDGRHLVFSSERAGGIGLWRIDASDSDDNHRATPTLLAGGGAKLKHPSVARRTGVVAYEEWQYEINLHERPVDPRASGADRPIASTADRWNFHPQLSPDGRRLVFQSTRSGQYELWLSDPDGNGARPLTRSGVYKSLARWSSDGRRLAFTMRTDAGFALMTLDVDDGATRTLATHSSGLVAPSWSHDGTAIYAGFLQGDWQIWRIDAASGARRQITTDGGYAAMESPDGRWLYVARLDGAGLWRRPVDGGPETLVADRVRAEQWPNWGLTARGIYYLTWPDDGDPQVALVEDGSTTPQLLTRLADYAWPGITLTRDGARLLYAHADRRTANIGGLTR